MNPADQELLARYTRDGAEDAFTELVRRHLDLVFSAAYRQVRSRELAQEIAQCVFMDLARQARQLAPNTILAAWLYHVTRRTAIDAMRKDARRLAREQIATSMNHLNESSSNWNEIEPLLDEAMDTLDEKERAAVLLRYFQNKSLREVGQSLGASEDAARKRVDRAIERLRKFLGRHGVRVGASGLASVLTVNAVQAAPPGLIGVLSAAAAPLGNALLTSSLVAGTKTIATTALHKTLIAGALTIAVGAGLYEARQVALARLESENLRRTHAVSLQELQELQRQNQEATNGAAAAQAELERVRRDNAQVLKLRGDLARVSTELRDVKQSSTNSGSEFSAIAENWVKRAEYFKQYFSDHPDKSIPELQLLWGDEWIFEARHNPTVFTNRSEGNTMEMIASGLRQSAKTRFATIVSHGISLYVAEHNGELPASLSQILPYLPQAGEKPDSQNRYASAQPVDEAMLSRYELKFTGPIGNVPLDQPFLVERSAVDSVMDSLLRMKIWGFNYESVGVINNMNDALHPLSDYTIIAPFLKQSELHEASK